MYVDDFTCHTAAEDVVRVSDWNSIASHGLSNQFIYINIKANWNAKKKQLKRLSLWINCWCLSKKEISFSRQFPFFFFLGRNTINERETRLCVCVSARVSVRAYRACVWVRTRYCEDSCTVVLAIFVCTARSRVLGSAKFTSFGRLPCRTDQCSAIETKKKKMCFDFASRFDSIRLSWQLCMQVKRASFEERNK